MRWSKKDISKLSYYTRNFNKQITNLSKNPAYSNVQLPDYLSYNYLKTQIQTRENFNSIISYLKGVNRPTFSKIEKVGSMSILHGEYKLLEKNRARLRNYLESELKRYFVPEPKSRIYASSNGKHRIFVL